VSCGEIQPQARLLLIILSSLLIVLWPVSFTVPVRAGTGNNRFESIQWVNRFSRGNRIAVEFSLSGHLEGRCQQCVPVGDKTGGNRTILLSPNSLLTY